MIAARLIQNYIPDVPLFPAYNAVFSLIIVTKGSEVKLYDVKALNVGLHDNLQVALK